MKNKRPFFRVLLVLMFAVVAHAESYYGPTVKNDRLYQIALALRPVDASVSQTMAALYELNKGAFLDSNINKLQTGSLLQVPTPYQIKAIPLKQANSLVSSHNDNITPAKPLLKESAVIPVKVTPTDSSATAKPKAILTKQIGASVENDAKLSAFISSKINLAIDKRIRAISDHYKAADIIPADNYASLEFTSVPAEVGTASIPRVNFSSANVGRSVDPVSISNPNKNDLDKLQQQLNELQIQLSSIINILQDNSGFLTSKKSIENQFAEIGGYALSSYLGNSFGLNATYVANPNLQISIALMIGILLFGFVIEGRTTRKKVPNEYISEELIDNPNDEYDFMGSTEGIPARMNLARAYFDMGFPDKARKVLTDIATRGDASQKKEARSMLMDLDN